MRTIQITERDMGTLRNLLASRSIISSRDQEHLEMLGRELDRADVVHPNDVPSDVITMYSQVRVRDLDTGKLAAYELVLPREADISRNRISVLAPLGTGLLGYREGEIVEWPMPGGMRRLKVEEVTFQPEAAGLEFAEVGPEQRKGQEKNWWPSTCRGIVG
jgi:regulator of nucleoside diphosphate kinase